jgi:branched-chain amino acid transport system permease protein
MARLPARARRALLRTHGLPLLAAAILLLVLLPLVLPARSYWLQLMFTVFVFAVMGHAWNLMAGYCGLLSFGNQVYVGLGAFAMAIAFYYGGLPIWLAWLFRGWPDLPSPICWPCLCRRPARRRGAPSPPCRGGPLGPL